ncbi:hypothetical protein COLO4_29074 [Corchorus olitorius]|uniref:Uncharacterized protein n=1 Tax=Corchorus olitorius TaxID=93759 RepID=A0A1R3HGB8_9ROSI|nr:hypothetical protein COLO4_29074 [Corchorus olitorius]
MDFASILFCFLAAYLKTYGEAIELITTAVRDTAKIAELIFDAEIDRYDKGSARKVLGSLIPELDAWHNLCIKVIDELKDKGDPTNNFDSRGIIEAIHEVALLSLTDKEREEKQTPTDPIFARIEDLMKKALLEKYDQTPNSKSEPSKTLNKYGISIIKHQYSRRPMVNVDMDFHFDVQYSGSYRPSVSFFYTWYKEKTSNSLPIVWDKNVASSNRTFRPSESDIGKRLKLESFVKVDREIFPANVTITNKVEPFCADHTLVAGIVLETSKLA